MKKFCKSDPSMCCEAAAYWREMSLADHARNEQIAEECESLHGIVAVLRDTLRNRDAQIDAMVRRKKPAAASKYGLSEIRRRA